jgi:hypothetical protein
MSDKIYAPIDQLGKSWTHHALSSRVLVVAKIELDVGDWAAYIDSVPGKNHNVEAEQVLHKGTKIPYWLAKELFPSIAKMYDWRP